MFEVLATTFSYVEGLNDSTTANVNSFVNDFRQDLAKLASDRLELMNNLIATSVNLQAGLTGSKFDLNAELEETQSILCLMGISDAIAGESISWSLPNANNQSLQVSNYRISNRIYMPGF